MGDGCGGHTLSVWRVPGAQRDGSFKSGLTETTSSASFLRTIKTTLSPNATAFACSLNSVMFLTH